MLLSLGTANSDHHADPAPALEPNSSPPPSPAPPRPRPPKSPPRTRPTKKIPKITARAATTPFRLANPSRTASTPSSASWDGVTFPPSGSPATTQTASTSLSRLSAPPPTTPRRPSTRLSCSTASSPPSPTTPAASTSSASSTRLSTRAPTAPTSAWFSRSSARTCWV